MQGEQWVILLYFLPFETEGKVKQDIITALKPNVSLVPADIQLTKRDDKYTAILKIPEAKGKIIEALKEVKVGDTIANVKRYYYDHQLYVNRMPKDIPIKEIAKYFSNFGPVLNVVLVPSIKNDDKYGHCFIKFQQSSSVDKVLLVRKVEISGREIRTFRTFRIGESEFTDKRLEITVEPIPDSIEVFENHINQHFQALGQLRERVRFEVNDKRTCKAIITFTSKEEGEQVLSKFDPNAINKGIYKIELKNWIHVVEQGGKVFVPGLIRNLDEAKVKSVFEIYGDISDILLTPSKALNSVNATITYSKMSSSKVLLAEYLYNDSIKSLFIGKPHIEPYLNAGDRKGYNNYIHKGKPQKSYAPIYLNNPNPAFGQPGQFFNPYVPQGQGLIPPYIPRPNFPTGK